MRSLTVQTCILFFLALAWFSWLQPWGSFRDPDTFYHAKVASYISFAHLESQPIPLDLTSLSSAFADQHFLYHLALVPFVRYVGLFDGTQIASVLFASGCIVLFYLLLRWRRVSFPELWTILAIVSPLLSFRLSLGKASPFAIGSFLIGISAIAVPSSIVGFLAGMFFALSHGGWAILLGTQIAYLVGDLFARRALERRPWIETFCSSPWRTCVGTVLGVAAGIFIHPDRQDLLRFLWVQVVRIGLGAGFSPTPLGQEWMALSPRAFLTNNAPLVIAVLLIGYALFLFPKRPLDVRRAITSTGFGVGSAVIIAFTLRSVRMVEYAVPIIILWVSALADLVDWTAVREWMSSVWKRKTRYRVLGWSLVILLSSAIIRQAIGARSALHKEAIPFNRMEGTAQILLREASPRDRVLNISWDTFPELFAWTNGLQFVSGMDPTFLYEGNPDLAVLYQKILEGSVTSTALEVMAREAFDARFVVIARSSGVPCIFDARDVIYKSDDMCVVDVRSSGERGAP